MASAKSGNYLSTIVWLDANIDNSADSQKIQARFRSIASELKTFIDSSACLNYLTNETKNVSLVVSGSFGENFVPLVHDFSHISHIYVFCNNRKKHLGWAGQHSKVRGVFVEEKELIQRIRTDQDDHKVIFAQPKWSHTTVNGPMFLWVTILVEILCRIPCTSADKKNFINYIREQHSENHEELCIIDEFERKYEPSKAVWWYTRDCFIYRTLNRAFRSQDYDFLYMFRWYIADLHHQITELCHKQLLSLPSNIKFGVVYRTSMLPLSFSEQLYVGDKFLWSALTSGTSNKEEVVKFVHQTSHSNNPYVLFQMTFTLKHALCAHISEMSYYPGEKKILFVMGTVFRIDSVEKRCDGIWNVKLYLTDEEVKGSKELKDYYMTHEFDNSVTTQLPLANLLRGMGDFDKAEKYYKLVVDKLPSSHEDVPLVYNNLGLLYLEKNMPTRAVEYCKKALELAHKRLPPHHITLARIYDSLAIIMLRIGDTSTAREYLDHTSAIKVSSDHPLLPTIQDHRGDIAIADGDLSSALDCYRIAQEMRKPPVMPDAHPDRAQSYVNIGRVFELQKKYKTALENYQAAYDIFKKSLLPTNPRLVGLKEAIQCLKQKSDN